MAEYQTIRPNVTGVRTAEIDEGLRAHMNKIYGTMSVGLLVTAGAAWGVGTSPALVEAIFATPLKWLVMFAPLILVFAFGAMINRLSAAGAQTFFYFFSAVMGYCTCSFIQTRARTGSVATDSPSSRRSCRKLP